MQAFYPSTLKEHSAIINLHAKSFVQTLAELQGNVTNEVEHLLKVETMKLFFGKERTFFIFSKSPSRHVS